MAALLALVLVATSAAMSEAAKTQKLMVESKKVNETITAEATLEFLIKNYDDSGDLHGSVKIGLFGEKVPMTVLNFVSLCNGVKRPQVGQTLSISLRDPFFNHCHNWLRHRFPETISYFSFLLVLKWL